MSNAQETLKNAVDVVQINLDQAVIELKQAISDSNKSNEKELSEAMNRLMGAYEKADSIIKSDVEELSADVTGLKKIVNEAYNAMQVAVNMVQINLDKSVEYLKQAISESNTEAADAFEKGISDLTSVYNILKAETDRLYTELNALSENTNSKILELKTKIAANDIETEENVQTLSVMNNRQEEQITASKNIATTGLVVAAISLGTNILLIILLLKKKR